jgi:taurine dioxygenase
MAYDVLDVKPMTRRIGAEIFGVDLGKPLSTVSSRRSTRP